MLFDIYLDRADLSSDLLTVIQRIPPFKDWTPKTGYQYLAVSEDSAAQAAEILSMNRLHPLVVPIDYSKAKVNHPNAAKLAERFLKQRAAVEFQGVTFGELQFLGENAFCWKFGLPSEELQKKEIVPGMLLTDIDKSDGHVWSESERIQLYFREFNLECKTDSDVKIVIDTLQQKFNLTSAVDYYDNMRTSLRSNSLLLVVYQHQHSQLTQKKFGITPNIGIRFRIIRNYGHALDALKLIFSIIEYFLRNNSDDLVFWEDRNHMDLIAIRKEQQITFPSTSFVFASLPTAMRM